MDQPEIRLDDLPETARDLVDVVGMNAALRIVDQLGGIRLYVPKIAKDDHALADLIGIDALKELVSMYGGEEIDVPRCAEAFRSMQQRRIIAELQHNSFTTIARRHGYTERGLRKMLRRAEAKGEVKTNQLDLFKS